MKLSLALALVSIIAFLIVDCRDVHDGRERHNSAGEPQQLKVKEGTDGRERRESAEEPQQLKMTTDERERRETIDKVLNQVFIQRTNAELPDVNEDGHDSSSAESIFESFMSKRSIDTMPSENRLRKSHRVKRQVHIEKFCPIGVPIGDCCYWFSCDYGLTLDWDASSLVCQALGASIGRNVGLADICNDDECCTMPLMEAIATRGKSCWLGARYEDPNWVCPHSEKHLSIKNPIWSNKMPIKPFNDTGVMACITEPYKRAYFCNAPCTADQCFVCQLFN